MSTGLLWYVPRLTQLRNCRKGKAVARGARKTEKEEDEELAKEAEAQEAGPFVFTESPACTPDIMSPHYCALTF